MQGPAASFQSKIVSMNDRFGDQRTVLKEEYRNSVTGMRQALLAILPKLMDRMFERLDDGLYALANKSDGSAVQTTYFDAMREVRRQREVVETAFNRRILGDFDRFWRLGPRGSTSELSIGAVNGGNGDGDFSLVEAEELEEGLAVENMVSKGDNQFFRDIYALNERFAHMIHGAEVDKKNNPLAPVAFCQAFQEAAQAIEVELAVKLVIYKHFDREVLNHLSVLYDEINTILANAGILPKLAHKVVRNKATSTGAPKAPGAQQGARDYYSAGQEYHLPDDNEGAQGMFGMLQQMLGGGRGASPQHRMESPEGGGSVMETPEMVALLSSLQHDGAPNAGAAPQENGQRNLRELVLGKAKAGGAEPRISKMNEDTIDIISMLFEFILDDKQLPDAMRALLSRLQIPMLKVAIIDKSFFSDRKHPARRLMNNLAQAAVHWSEKHGRREGGLYNKIDSIVTRILDGFEDDLNLFVELNEEFDEFQKKDQRASRQTEERTAQTTQGKERLTGAKSVVDEAIDSRLFSRPELPEVVVALVTDGWKDLLLLTHLRQGEDSDDWKRYLALLDKLIWSVEPKNDPRERQQLLKDIPSLLDGLKKGLASISYDQHKMTRLFHELQNCHIQCFRNGSVSTPKVATGDSDAAKSERRERPPEPEKIEDEFAKRADALQIGSWIEVAEEDGSHYRAKLSWKSSVTGTYLFVNRKGLKVAEVTRDGVAKWFRENRAFALEEGEVPLMDRALTAMMKSLKNRS